MLSARQTCTVGIAFLSRGGMPGLFDCLPKKGLVKDLQSGLLATCFMTCRQPTQKEMQPQ